MNLCASRSRWQEWRNKFSTNKNSIILRNLGCGYSRSSVALNALERSLQWRTSKRRQESLLIGHLLKSSSGLFLTLSTDKRISLAGKDILECLPHIMISSSRWARCIHTSGLAHITCFAAALDWRLRCVWSVVLACSKFKLLLRCWEVLSFAPLLRRCVDAIVHHHNRHWLQDPYNRVRWKAH